MTITTATCPWPGNGSRSVNPGNQQHGPFRMRIAGAGAKATFPSSSAPAAFTMSVWVQPRTTGNNTILTRTVQTAFGSAPTWRIGVEGGRFVASLWDTAGRKSVTGDVVTANRWYYLTVRATQNGQLTLYVNGRQSGTPVSIGSFLPSTAPSYTVGSYTVTAPGFDVAALNVYNQGLPLAEIRRNCNGLKYRFPGMNLPVIGQERRPPPAGAPVAASF